jgi:predicted enzyme related to lactoylglutathione lyase
MIERDGYPAGVPCWVDTAQPDPEAAAQFYGGLFGWEFEDRTPAGSPLRYLVGRLHGCDVAGVGSLPEDAGDPTWNTYVWVDDAEAASKAIERAGGTVLMEPFDVNGAGRMAVFADPTGAAFSIWEAKDGRGAQLVNEPGTWNFSGLNTRDPEVAKRFYAEVFGWEANAMGEDDGAGAVWRLPGYGDYLERLDPGMRARMAEVQAPDGFEDAVAWMTPMSDDQFSPDTSPHWHVTFAVDDADATAARAEELGGRVLMAPVDAPWVRMSVLSDPQGAVFTASKFTPPAS